MDVGLRPEARLDPFRCSVSGSSVRFTLILLALLEAFHPIHFLANFPTDWLLACESLPSTLLWHAESLMRCT